MVERSVVKRYVEALFGVARRENSISEVEADLQVLEQVFAASPRLMRLLTAPFVDAPRKQEILSRALTEQLNPLTLRFVLLLLEKHREEVLPLAGEEFTRVHYQHRGIQPGRLTVAQPISSDEVEELGAALSRRLGRQVELTVEVDPDLLGDGRVVLGDTVIDDSLQGRLRRLREHLIAGTA